MHPGTMHHCTMHHAPCTMHHTPCSMLHAPCNATCDMPTLHLASSPLSHHSCVSRKAVSPRRRVVRTSCAPLDAATSGIETVEEVLAAVVGAVTPPALVLHQGEPPTASRPLLLSFQEPGFSAKHSLPGPPSLCSMPGHGSSPHQKVPGQRPLGWFQGQMSQERRRKARQPNRHHSLQ